MNHAVYPSAFSSGIVERSVEGAGGVLPLVCRWPEAMTPKGFVIFCHGLSASGRDYAEL